MTGETREAWLKRLDAARTLVVLAAQVEVQQERATEMLSISVEVLAKVESEEPAK